MGDDAVIMITLFFLSAYECLNPTVETNCCEPDQFKLNSVFILYFVWKVVVIMPQSTQLSLVRNNNNNDDVVWVLVQIELYGFVICGLYWSCVLPQVVYVCVIFTHVCVAAGGSTETSQAWRPRSCWSLEAFMAASSLDPARRTSEISLSLSGTNLLSLHHSPNPPHTRPQVSCRSRIFFKFLTLCIAATSTLIFHQKPSQWPKQNEKWYQMW